MICAAINDWLGGCYLGRRKRSAMAHNKTKEVTASQQLHEVRRLLVLLHGTTGVFRGLVGRGSFSI
jgi:hypothetical protein